MLAVRTASRNDVTPSLASIASAFVVTTMTGFTADAGDGAAETTAARTPTTVEPMNLRIVVILLSSADGRRARFGVLMQGGPLRDTPTRQNWALRPVPWPPMADMVKSVDTTTAKSGISKWNRIEHRLFSFITSYPKGVRISDAEFAAAPLILTSHELQRRWNDTIDAQTCRGPLVRSPLHRDW